MEIYFQKGPTGNGKRGEFFSPWWRHQMEKFSALLALCVGNSPAIGEFPAQRPVTLSFDFFFELCLNKRLSKQSWGWWFETPSHPLWHVIVMYYAICYTVRCRYHAVQFLQIPHNRHYIARPWERDIWCLLWVKRLIDLLLLSLQCCM